jgi:hypothetical protein
MTDAPNQDLPNSRLTALVEDLKDSIEEIKAVIAPILETVADEIQAKVQELGSAIDAKLAELGQALIDVGG